MNVQEVDNQSPKRVHPQMAIQLHHYASYIESCSSGCVRLRPHQISNSCAYAL